MLKFSVKADGFDALQEKLSQACTKAEHIVATQVRKDTSPYVPFLTGSLDQRTMVDGNAIIYPGPYARFCITGKSWLTRRRAAHTRRKAERRF